MALPGTGLEFTFSTGIMDLRPHMKVAKVKALLSAYSRLDLTKFVAYYWQQAKDAYTSGRASSAAEDLKVKSAPCGPGALCVGSSIRM